MDKEQMAEAAGRIAADNAEISAGEAKISELEQAGTLEATLLKEAGLESEDGETSDAGDKPAENKAQPVSPQDEGKSKAPDGETKDEPEKKGIAEDFTRRAGKSNVKRLLAQRNEAKKEAAEERERRIELEKQLEARTSEDSEPTLRDAVADVLSEREADKSEWDALYERFPDARVDEDAVKAEMDKHPTLSPLGIYKLIKPEAFVQQNESGTGGIDVGGRITPSQLQESNILDKSTSEIEAYLKAEERAGRLE